MFKGLKEIQKKEEEEEDFLNFFFRFCVFVLSEAANL